MEGLECGFRIPLGMGGSFGPAASLSTAAGVLLLLGRTGPDRGEVSFLTCSRISSTACRTKPSNDLKALKGRTVG